MKATQAILDKSGAKRASLELKDRIAITVSVFALIIAAAGFYYQNLRVSRELSVATVAPWVGPGTLMFEVAFFNTGNATALVDTAYPIVAKATRDNGPPTQVGSIERPKGLPALLDPGKILKLTLATKFRPDYLHGFGTDPKAPLRREHGWKAIPVGLRIIAYDGHGERHDVSTAPLFVFGLKDDGTVAAPSGDHEAHSVY